MRAFTKICNSTFNPKEQFQIHIALPFKLHTTIELTPYTTIQDFIKEVCPSYGSILNTTEKNSKTISTTLSQSLPWKLLKIMRLLIYTLPKQTGIITHTRTVHVLKRIHTLNTVLGNGFIRARNCKRQKEFQLY